MLGQSAKLGIKSNKFEAVHYNIS